MKEYFNPNILIYSYDIFVMISVHSSAVTEVLGHATHSPWSLCAQLAFASWCNGKHSRRLGTPNIRFNTVQQYILTFGKLEQWSKFLGFQEI